MARARPSPPHGRHSITGYIFDAAIKFLRERFAYESELALVSAFGDFGKLLSIELHGKLVFSEDKDPGTN